MAGDPAAMRLAVAEDLAGAEAELLEIFLEEADELLASIDGALHVWRQERDNPEHNQKLQRDLHTLKGGARMSGLSYLGNLSHDMESVLIEQDQNGLPLDDDFFGAVDTFHESLLSTVDLVKAGPGEIPAAGAEPAATIVEVPVPSEEQSAEAAERQTPSPGIAQGARQAVAEDLMGAEAELLEIFLEEADELLSSIDGGAA